MSHWEAVGKSDEWYTPKYIFEALGSEFDLDPANAAPNGWHVPAKRLFSERGLEQAWSGHVWLNPPFGGRNSLTGWLLKFFDHGDGIVLVPDRTSAPWFQRAAKRANAILFLSPKVKFERPDGTLGKSPSTGTALMAAGPKACEALRRAAPRLGLLVTP